MVIEQVRVTNEFLQVPREQRLDNRPFTHRTQWSFLVSGLPYRTRQCTSLALSDRPMDRTASGEQSEDFVGWYLCR